MSLGKLSDPNVEILESRLFNIHTVYIVQHLCLGFLVNIFLLIIFEIHIDMDMDINSSEKIFLTGTPGSKYNAIFKIIESLIDNKNLLIKDNYPAILLSGTDKKILEHCVICLYQKDNNCLQSWVELGIQDITREEMQAVIKNHNKQILSFAMKHCLKLEKFTPYWVERTLHKEIDFDYDKFEDIFVAIYQPELPSQVK